MYVYTHKHYNGAFKYCNHNNCVHTCKLQLKHNAVSCTVYMWPLLRTSWDQMEFCTTMYGERLLHLGAATQPYSSQVCTVIKFSLIIEIGI